ncbi:flagellar hook assembly protein FlgD [Cupriavidus sp. SW-Y-13]|uniref:flagellar hook assembly protein FlgD n=1 Tax=Cupriavidus sp. SW-Y-13 TaxID=2653854 RepID=UPI0013663ABC|nr:flagellar hook capping FlgD N-terminal domain-containing protein [Cupriavidus sp. SW-Y-13]MWL90520.1 flagellar hook capping protein [Cupriavidus sp. SW-Y-13]
MASIDSVGSASLQSGSIGLQDFMKILLTQLTYQDPLKPMDNQEFMAQIAQFTSLEQAQQINTKLDTMLSSQSSQQSVGLIGKTVEVSTQSGTAVGTVSSLSLASGTPQLTITTTAGATLPGISLSQINTIR